MVNGLPKQPDHINHSTFTTFSKGVNHYLKIKGMTQADLMRASLLSKTKISRICRDLNDKGSYYTPTWDDVMAISIGLGLTREEAEKLFFAAFPEMEHLGEFLDKRLNIQQVNQILYDSGLRVLGNVLEE